MHTRAMELTVGSFLLAGLLAFAFLAVKVSGLSPGLERGDTYHLYARFNNASGLNNRARVTIAGVPVGRVTAIGIDPLDVRARVEMEIDSSVDYITEDSIAAIQTAGILGEKYIAISVGGAFDILDDGDEIRDTQSAIVLEELIGRFLSNMGDAQ